VVKDSVARVARAVKAKVDAAVVVARRATFLKMRLAAAHRKN
jgi:hypothetical protein